MTRVRDRTFLIAGLILVGAALVGGSVTGPGWWSHMGPWHSGMMGGRADSVATQPIRGAAEVEVTATDFAFSPAEITVTAGKAVNLTLVNRGSIPHDLVVAELDVQVDARPGRSSTVGLVPGQAGRYSIVCTYPGHAESGMRGTLKVVEP